MKRLYYDSKTEYLEQGNQCSETHNKKSKGQACIMKIINEQTHSQRVESAHKEKSCALGEAGSSDGDQVHTCSGNSWHVVAA